MSNTSTFTRVTEPTTKALQCKINYVEL